MGLADNLTALSSVVKKLDGAREAQLARFGEYQQARNAAAQVEAEVQNALVAVLTQIQNAVSKEMMVGALRKMGYGL